MYRNSSTYKQIMKKWKYYGLNDSKQEALGILYAESIEEAYDIASRMK